MAVPLLQASFTTGEIAPSMFGRTDVARYHTAATTMRNFFPSYRGPAYSRAGTKFAGYSKQTGRNYRPRLIPFQFSVSQGLVLEFGNFYMRVLFDGAFVTEPPVNITGITQANPTVVTAPAQGATAAASNTGGVTATYAPGDTVTLAGGVYLAPAVLTVGQTILLSVTSVPSGTGYAPGNTITLAGGTQVVAPVVTIGTTTAASLSITNGGSGGADGTATVTGTSGAGTKYQASVTISGGIITAINSIISGGSYTANPSPTADPVTGGGVTGATFATHMAPLMVTLTTAGVFTTNPTGNSFTQASTSGVGTGATFTSALLAPYTVAVTTAGSYTTIPANPVTQGSTSGTGAGATFNLTWGTAAAFNVGDWLYFTGIGGMTELNGETYVVSAVSGANYNLQDVFGNPVNSTSFPAYTSGGTANRVYTLTTIYSEQDLDWLKFVESADSITLCCVNQTTGAEYIPQDLVRKADDNWSFQPVVPVSSVAPPSSAPTITVTPPPSGTQPAQADAYYEYVVTSVNQLTGEESIASAIGTAGPASDISQVLGTVTISWNTVANVFQYNVYKAPVGYQDFAPLGSLFGYIGTAFGASFVDTNITPDFTQVPPSHDNPFARGQIEGVNVTAGGFYPSAIGTAVSTSTGSGAVIETVGFDGPVQAFIVTQHGQNYLSTDQAVITGVGGGSGGAAALVVGPNTGTYPGVASYFQERRAYANALNEPDTYWMSQPGAFQNFDARVPPISSDAITGSPWATQVNGIQWMLQTSGGLLVMTGLSAWLLVGSGSFATNVQPISPSTQDNVPQAFSGCSPKVFPVKINYDVIYLTSKNSHYYDLPYQLYALSEPIDISDISSHLFDNYTILDNAWCEQPNKLFWAIRSDGVMLSLTYYKTQQIQGWARHDTFGEFVSCAAVTELPVDALYLATQRTISGNTAYMIERMDNRLWANVEEAWCVDCGLSLAQPTPAGTLSISAAVGAGIPTGVTGLVGGSGYSAGTTAILIDEVAADIQPGTGATVALTIAAGIITAVAITGGTLYQQPAIVVTDPAGSAGGSGFSARVVLNNATTLTATASVFANVGDVVRAGGGIAAITNVISGTQATANVLMPFPTIPNSAIAVSYQTGDWTLATPVTKVSGLSYLVGATVTGLADGNVIPPTIVAADGSITLATPASAVTVGLGYQCQLQGVYADAGDPTIQGQRKKASAVTVRQEASRGIKVGANQMDGSTQSPIQLAPKWPQMQQLPDAGQNTDFSSVPYNALAVPLRTGDVRAAVSSGWATPGQIAIQQDYPLPAQVSALIPEYLMGDTVQTTEPQKQQRGRQ